MNFFTLTKLGRTLLLTAVVAVGLLSVGCGGDDGGNDNPANNGSNNNGGNNTVGNNTCTSGGSCKSKEMPDGKKWLTENLNIETADSWCYNGSPDSCRKYGRLYTWSAANATCQSIGWRLPDTSDWNRLVAAAGGQSTAGKKLKAASGWNNNGNGTNETGFSALPGGFRGSNGGFNHAGNDGNWWTATEYDAGGAYYRDVYYDDDYVDEDYDDKSLGFSVRCVKDA